MTIGWPGLNRIFADSFSLLNSVSKNVKKSWTFRRAGNFDFPFRFRWHHTLQYTLSQGRDFTVVAEFGVGQSFVDQTPPLWAIFSWPKAPQGVQILVKHRFDKSITYSDWGICAHLWHWTSQVHWNFNFGPRFVVFLVLWNWSISPAILILNI